MTISNNFFHKNKVLEKEKTLRMLKLVSFEDTRLISRTVTGYKFSETSKGGGKKSSFDISKMITAIGSCSLTSTADFQQ